MTQTGPQSHSTLTRRCILAFRPTQNGLMFSSENETGTENAPELSITLSC